MKIKIIAQVYLPIYINKENEVLDTGITVDVVLADCDINPGMTVTCDKLNGPSPLYTDVKKLWIDIKRCVYCGELKSRDWEELRQVYDEAGLTLPGEFNLDFEFPFDCIPDNGAVLFSTDILCIQNDIVGTVHDIVLHFYE